MNTLFPIEQYELKPALEVHAKASEPVNLYVLVANWRGQWWKVWDKTFLTKEAAIEFFNKQDAGWIERKIYHLTP